MLAEEEIGVADRFHLVAPVPTNEIVSFLSTADVGIHPLAMGLPNHELALPNKIFDYLHAGLPVATSRVALLSQLIKDTGIGETFDPEDPQDIAAAVERILGDHNTYAARVQDKDLLSRFSWEAQEANLRDVYDAVGGSVALPKS